ncbi:MAG: lysophospholipid acyltransferase family protein [Arenicellales bacterium]
MTALFELLGRALLRVLSPLPLQLLRRVGRGLGELLARLDTEIKRVADINLKRCFPHLSPADHAQLLSETIKQSAMLAAELPFLWSARSSERWRSAIEEIHGEHLLQRHRSDNSGLLILVPHIGNWEFLSLYLADYRITATYSPLRSPVADRLLSALRSNRGTRMVPIGVSGIRSIYRALQGGSAAVLLPDQVPERSAGIYASFFNHPALTMTLAFRLAASTGADVVLGACFRSERGFRLEFRGLDGFPVPHDDEVNARKLNQAIEELIQRYPPQYQWSYKRFKRQPKGSPDIYRPGSRRP